MLEPRTNEAAHHPPPLGDLGVAKFGVSAANNSTNIYPLGYAEQIGRSWDRDDRDGPNVAAVCYLLQPFF
jgi:hypothetical protein